MQYNTLLIGILIGIAITLLGVFLVRVIARPRKTSALPEPRSTYVIQRQIAQGSTSTLADKANVPDVAFTASIVALWPVKPGITLDEPDLAARSDQTSTFTESSTDAPIQPEGTAEPPTPLKLPSGIAPLARGGRPRTEGNSKNDQRLRRASPSAKFPKPELVCWQQDGAWQMGLEWSELAETLPDSAWQEGKKLIADSKRERTWLIEQFEGSIIFADETGIAILEVNPMSPSEPYVVFRLMGETQRQGRHVSKLSKGAYLICASVDWIRDETASSPAQRADEPVQIAGFCAHFFDNRNEDEAGQLRLVLQHPDQPLQRIEFSYESARFSLSGLQFPDADAFRSPLFCTHPPMLSASASSDWGDVGNIVVGEEGGNGDRWRTQFKPDPGLKNQVIHPLHTKVGGWFFVRIYDHKDILLESLDFRFLRGLHSLEVVNGSLLPIAGVHVPITLTIIHEPMCTLVLDTETPVSGIAIVPSDKGTEIKIRPDAVHELTHWHIEHQEGTSVSVSIDVPKVWWAFHTLAQKPEVWIGTPVTLKREEMSANSDCALWLKLPVILHDTVLKIGFSMATARAIEYQPDTTLSIPMRLFGDAPEIMNSENPLSLRLWAISSETIEEALLASFEGLENQPDSHDSSNAPSSFIPETTSDEDESEQAEVVVETHVRDYAAEINVNNPDYVWHSIYCAPGTEKKLCNTLNHRVRVLHLEADIPTILFPIVEKVVHRGYKPTVQTEPLFMSGYVLAQIRPGTSDLNRILQDTGARLIPEPITSAEVCKILEWKQARATDPLRKIALGCRVLITEGDLKNRIAVVESLQTNRNEAILLLAGSTRMRFNLSLDSLLCIESASPA